MTPVLVSRLTCPTSGGRIGLYHRMGVGVVKEHAIGAGCILDRGPNLGNRYIQYQPEVLTRRIAFGRMTSEE